MPNHNPAHPLTLSRAPLRISFFGGGTDYPEYFCQAPGSVLVATMNHYVHVTVHTHTRFTPYQFSIHYSAVERVNALDEIRHPSARECLRKLNLDKSMEIHYVSDLPARTGLGSSSSATVALLAALHRHLGQSPTPTELAVEAIHVEREKIAQRVGCQDQYAASLGGFRHLRFRDSDITSAHEFDIMSPRIQELHGHLMLFYTGVQRSAHEILEEQVRKTKDGTNSDLLAQLNDMAERAVDMLKGKGDLTEFGELLHESWKIKRSLSSSITTPNIDRMYESARDAGAVGGKLLGAGSGGFLLLFVVPDLQHGVRHALGAEQEVLFEFTDRGAEIIYPPHQPD